jgi:hypothetical protein
MTHTLVDCACEAIVHPDGSGVDIVYCDMHYAAPDLWEALELLLSIVELQEYYGFSGELVEFPEVVKKNISKAHNAILKARGGYYDTPN